MRKRERDREDKSFHRDANYVPSSSATASRCRNLHHPGWKKRFRFITSALRNYIQIQGLDRNTSKSKPTQKWHVNVTGEEKKSYLSKTESSAIFYDGNVAIMMLMYACRRKNIVISAREGRRGEEKRERRQERDGEVTRRDDSNEGQGRAPNVKMKQS